MNPRCYKKFKYKSEKRAKQANKHSNRAYKVYFCDNCKYWHLGSGIE